MNDISSESYRPRGIVKVNRGLGLSQASHVFPSHPQEDLVYRGGRTIADLRYKTFYLGKSWAQGALAAARQNLDAALAAAMSDPRLNEIVGQYFGGSNITTAALASTVLDLTLQSTYDKGDIHDLVQKTYMSGALSAVDLDTCVISYVLPPQAILSSEGGAEAIQSAVRAPRGTPEEEEANSKNGLGGYHGSVHIPHPGSPITIYYAVATWSEGDNGIPIPGWEPWENVCATFYHELNEARTDPDVEDAIRTGDVRWIGWNSRTGREIGDFPIDQAGSNLSLVFKKVPVAATPGTVPVQLMWSNRIHGPEAPSHGSAMALAVAAAQASIRIVTLGVAASTPPTFGAGIPFSPPGKVADFKKPSSAAEWSTFLSKFFDDAVAATQSYLKGLPSQFFNPSKGIPGAPDHAELPIKWPGFPRLLENSRSPA